MQPDAELKASRYWKHHGAVRRDGLPFLAQWVPMPGLTLQMLGFNEGGGDFGNTDVDFSGRFTLLEQHVWLFLKAIVPVLEGYRLG